MTTIDYTTTGHLASLAREWATATATDKIDIEQVVLEVLDSAEYRAEGESISYELGARFTKSGRTEVFSISNLDFLSA